MFSPVISIFLEEDTGVEVCYVTVPRLQSTQVTESGLKRRELTLEHNTGNSENAILVIALFQWFSIRNGFVSPMQGYI